jgi:hypothetical protein
MEDLEFIKRFSKINIKAIAKANGVNTSNLYTGRCGSHNTWIMRKAIEAEIAKLYIDDYEQAKKS